MSERPDGAVRADSGIQDDAMVQNLDAVADLRVCEASSGADRASVPDRGFAFDDHVRVNYRYRGRQWCAR